MSLLVSLLIVNALHGPLPQPALPADSIGQEVRGGQRLVRHRVTQGETIYALGRRYHVTAEQLLAANPQLKNGLGIGEIVLVPRPGKGTAAAVPATPAAPAKAPATAAAAPAPAASTPATYTVAKGETLFGIAKRYNTTPAALAELNGLPAGSGVRVGQELRLRSDAATAPAATAPPVAAAPPVAKPTPARAPLPVPTPAPAKVDTNREAVVATVTPAPAEPVEKEKIVIKDKDGNKEKEKIKEEAAPRTPTRAADLVGRKVEDGIGAGIDNSGTDKYLALHQTAPIGTIMEVRNTMNGQTVYVRVIGQLPDTGENDNILVRLSPRAVAKLGTNDAKFRVETSYVP